MSNSEHFPPISNWINYNLTRRVYRSSSVEPYEISMILHALSLILLQFDWWEWINNDPVGRGISSIIFTVVFGAIVYFICTPLLLRKMEDIERVRDGEHDEWWGNCIQSFYTQPLHYYYNVGSTCMSGWMNPLDLLYSTSSYMQLWCLLFISYVDHVCFEGWKKWRGYERVILKSGKYWYVPFVNPSYRYSYITKTLFRDYHSKAGKKTSR